MPLRRSKLELKERVVALQDIWLPASSLFPERVVHQGTEGWWVGEPQNQLFFVSWLSGIECYCFWEDLYFQGIFQASEVPSETRRGVR